MGDWLIQQILVLKKGSVSPKQFFQHQVLSQKEILPGVWAMHGGNGNQTLSAESDTDINFDDRTYWEAENGDIAKYRIGDYNLNGDTNFNDRRVWELNNGKFTSVPRD